MMPLHTYVAEVEAITPIPAGAIRWAMESCHGGIPPEQFAKWLELSASPSVATPNPLGAGRSKNPREVHESLAGAQFEKEPA